MFKTRLLSILCIIAFTNVAFCAPKNVELVRKDGVIHNPIGPRSEIPTVSYEDDDVTISCDSIIHDVTIVIRDQYGNVMHQSTQTVSPMESTIFVPDTGDGSEKSTIDLYYDRKHLRGEFDE